MKNLKLLVVVLVAMFGFIACDKHECNDYDHSADLVGTWTCIKEGFAEALVISADGSMVATGLADGMYWENAKGTITVKDGKATLAFEDNVNFEGHFDIIPGMAFSILADNGERVTFNYCKEDLSEEIVGMWVCTQTPSGNAEEMLIQTFYENGKTVYTGFEPFEGDVTLNHESKYKVIGDLNFIETNGGYLVWKLISSQNGTSLGDIMTFTNDANITASWLRVKQSLSLSGENYDYSKIFVTNAKGLDQDFIFAGQTLNFSKMEGVVMDKMMKNILFNVSFPSANTLSYNCYFNGKLVATEAPISVNGNKVTIKMSERNPVYRDIDLYCFQDVDNCQLHMYMSTTAFTNFFANVSVVHLADKGQLDLNDASAVAAIFEGVDNAIESINVSIVMENHTKAF